MFPLPPAGSGSSVLKSETDIRWPSIRTRSTEASQYSAALDQKGGGPGRTEGRACHRFISRCEPCPSLEINGS